MRSMQHSIKSNYWLQSILNSYSMIFFSLSNVLALIIILVTFFSPKLGVCGFLSVGLINAVAYLMGFNREEIKSGLFGFNALLLGLSLGYDYTIDFTFISFFITASLVLLLITVWMKGLFSTKNLPFLSFPFIITYWIISLAASNFSNISFNDQQLSDSLGQLQSQPSVWFSFTHLADTLLMPDFVSSYFRTLSGTFFQTSILGGILIALGLMYASRIAFSLSIIGFYLAYFFYSVFGADVNDLTYNLLGSNFIFLAIAVGCFFIIPNIYSYITVVVLIPILLLILLAVGKILFVFQLKAYSLSFSVVCTAFLFSLNQRWLHNNLQLVTIQYFSAEKTIYKYLNSLQRFKHEHLYKLLLPFTGEWRVSQGYNGKITHLGDWGKALDFDIIDEEGNTYRKPKSAREGFSTDNFYCYNKEIIAPYDGYVYDIVNTVAENDVGEVNTEYNWGNTIIINHLNGLFSQISHVKKDSFNVFIGQYVTKGTYLATCGNSGRSPEPHIHFQLQTNSTIGATTLEYPIAYFIERKGDKRSLKVSEIPEEGSLISNVRVNQLLLVAFSFLPGQKITFKNEQTNEITNWEVFTDAYNRLYIYCKVSNSYAYFVNDGVMLYFTDFEGDKSSLLFNFYLAAYRQLLGYYEDMPVSDSIPLIHFNNKLVQFFQDFVSPFYLFTKANHTSKFTYTDNSEAPQKLMIQSQVETKVMGISTKKINFEFELIDNKLNKFAIHHKNKTESFINIL